MRWKIFRIFCVFVVWIIVSLLLTPVTAQSCLHDGDVNQDGRITPADALLAFRHFLGSATPPLDMCQQARANVATPANSGITPADALCIFQKFLGVPSCLASTPLPTAKEQVQALEQRGELPQLDRSSDIKGPDSNANGIRDDVENYIASLPITSEQNKAVEQLAKTLQAALLVDTTDSSALAQVDNNNTRAVHCVSDQFPDIMQSGAIITRIQAITANTKERAMQYIRYNHALSGNFIDLPEGNTCD